LAWSNRINRAALLAIVKDAVAIRFFLEALAMPLVPNEGGSDSFYVFATKFGESSNFLLIDPDKTGFPRAAVATLGASESEAILVPRIGHEKPPRVLGEDSRRPYGPI
jgi:hypothetical protein